LPSILLPHHFLTFLFYYPVTNLVALTFASSRSLLSKEVFMKYGNYQQFINFLQQELAIPARAVACADRIRQRVSPYKKDQSAHLLSMILWQYGLINLEQLNRSFVWLSEF
jgi:hypothetical protein